MLKNYAWQMTERKRRLLTEGRASIVFVARVLIVAGLLCIPLRSASAADQPSVPDSKCTPPTVPGGFRREEMDVNGATISYAIGGSGPPLVLIHGFPQDRTAWDKVIAELASTFTILAPDMRGIGQSRAPSDTSFDAITLSEDVRALAAELGLDRPFVVGHDMGGIVAYTLARANPDELRGVMLIENPLPGITPWNAIAADPAVWHINFHQAADTPELLISGREAGYFRLHFYRMGMRDPTHVDAAALQRYACAYAGLGRLTAGLGQYRATDVNAEFIGSQDEPTALPAVLVGGEQSLGDAMAEMAEALRQKGWTALTLEVVPGGSHYLLDEDAGPVAALIRKHAGIIR